MNTPTPEQETKIVEEWQESLTDIVSRYELPMSESLFNALYDAAIFGCEQMRREM